MRLLQLLIAFLSVVMLNSCCTQKGCTEQILYFSLYDFNIQDVDSIWVKSYQKGTNFQTVKDSIFKKFSSQDSMYRIEVNDVNNRFNFDRDYEIYFGSINNSYRITNITTRKEVCNQCFPFGSEKYNRLNSYQVNGQLIIASSSVEIKIKK